MGVIPQKMKIPKSVRIGGHTYKVKLVSRVDSVDSEGEMDNEAGTIRLLKTLTPTALEAAFIHEALHGMNSTLNHELLDSLAEQVFQFLHDNKLLK